jgi:hypothetical protein
MTNVSLSKFELRRLCAPLRLGVFAVKILNREDAKALRKTQRGSFRRNVMIISHYFPKNVT